MVSCPDASFISSLLEVGGRAKRIGRASFLVWGGGADLVYGFHSTASASLCHELPVFPSEVWWFIQTVARFGMAPATAGRLALPQQTARDLTRVE